MGLLTMTAQGNEALPGFWLRLIIGALVAGILAAGPLAIGAQDWRIVLWSGLIASASYVKGLLEPQPVRRSRK